MQLQIRLRLGKSQVNLHFLSPCANFVPTMKDKFKHTALVLEGGGMRGVFTSGVLDWMIDNNITFPYLVGVSAGSSNALSFASHQRGRAKYTFSDLQVERHYLGIHNLWRHHSIMDMDLLYRELPEKIWPYDYEAYRTNPMRVESVATDCLTGEAVYLEEKENPERIIDIVRASSALPFACPIAYVDGHPMIDGGIADSIPLQHALDQGYEHVIVVLTRHKGYRKKEKPTHIPSFVYRRYPKLREALSTRGARYNAQVELVERLEREGRITVIRPDHPVDVARIETDMNKMNALYQHGFEVAERIIKGEI